MKTTKNEKRYVPQPLLELLHICDYQRKDDLYCIIDLIYRRQVIFKSTIQKQYGFSEIGRKSFQKLIARAINIKNGIDFLVENGFIIRNDFYVRGFQTKGYKIKSEYLATKVPVEITDKNINKRIKKLKLEVRKVRVKNLEFAKSRYYKSFKIDSNAALAAANTKALSDIRLLVSKIKYNLSDSQIQEIIDCNSSNVKNRMMILVHPDGKELHNILHRLMIHQQQIYSINDGFLYFKRNRTNGRLDTNLTSLPSYLRRFIISDEKIFNLDIKNSQPFFLYVRLKNNNYINKLELAHYGDLVVSGRLYEYLIEKFEELTGKKRTREQMKKILFSIFYSKISSFTCYKQPFREIFPSIMEVIDMTNAEQHNTLAIELQTLESHMILDHIMPELREIGIIPFTIHDSFLVSESELVLVKQMIDFQFQETYGLKPALHEDELLNLKIDDCEDEIIDNGDLVCESFFAT